MTSTFWSALLFDALWSGVAATGFGEYQPLDVANTDEAHRRNRRIEFKITER